MDKINVNKIIEYSFVFLLFAIMLNAGCGVLFEHKIVHGYPFGLLASDAFQHQTRTEAIKDMGNYRNEAYYIAHGYRDVIGYYMPVYYHLSVLFSYASGLESWDAVYFLLFFSSCIAALVMYIVIRNLNRYAAILSLPLSVLVFSKVPYVGYTWGQWPNIFALFFLTLFFWSVHRIDLKYSYLLIGLLLAAVEMTHTTMFIFGVLFLCFYLGMLFLLKKLRVERLKRFFLAGIVFLIFGGYYFIIFQRTWNRIYSFKFQSITSWPGGSGSFNFLDFRLLIIPIVIGIIISLFMLKKKNMLPSFAGIFALVMGYSNYVGFRHRAFTLRIFWPIFLSVFLGIGMYYILKFFLKKMKMVYAVVIALVLLILINSVSFAAFLIPHPVKFPAQGLMDPYHWNTFMWLQQNTPEDATILFFHGDVYNQDALLRNSKREHYMVEPDSRDGEIGFIDALQNQTVRRFYRTNKPGDSGAMLPYKKGFFSYGFHAEEDDKSIWFKSNGDICQYDYYVFDKFSRQQVLAQYNTMIMQEMLKSDNIDLVYENDITFIAKNKKPGDDCVEV